MKSLFRNPLTKKLKAIIMLKSITGAIVDGGQRLGIASIAILAIPLLLGLFGVTLALGPLVVPLLMVGSFAALWGMFSLVSYRKQTKEFQQKYDDYLFEQAALEKEVASGKEAKNDFMNYLMAKPHLMSTMAQDIKANQSYYDEHVGELRRANPNFKLQPKHVFVPSLRAACNKSPYKAAEALPGAGGAEIEKRQWWSRRIDEALEKPLPSHWATPVNKASRFSAQMTAATLPLPAGSSSVSTTPITGGINPKGRYQKEKVKHTKRTAFLRGLGVGVMTGLASIGVILAVGAAPLLTVPAILGIAVGVGVAAGATYMLCDSVTQKQTNQSIEHIHATQKARVKAERDKESLLYGKAHVAGLEELYKEKVAAEETPAAEMQPSPSPAQPARRELLAARRKVEEQRAALTETSVAESNPAPALTQEKVAPRLILALEPQEKVKPIDDNSFVIQYDYTAQRYELTFYPEPEKPQPVPPETSATIQAQLAMLTVGAALTPQQQNILQSSVQNWYKDVYQPELAPQLDEGWNPSFTPSEER